MKAATEMQVNALVAELEDLKARLDYRNSWNDGRGRQEIVLNGEIVVAAMEYGVTKRRRFKDVAFYIHEDA